HRMLEGSLPDVPIGDHCSRPHDCPFLERCWPKLPDHHVSSLYRIERKKVLEYEADGYATLYDLPSDLELSAIHARQVRAVTEGPGDRDPRPALAEALVAACPGARRIVAYYASFERDCIRQLAVAVPRLAKELERIERRLVDLLPLLRNHVYHPDFGGSFSIKRTLPALVPGLSYADLKIREGETATLELMRLLFSGDELCPGERAQLREALLRY